MARDRDRIPAMPKTIQQTVRLPASPDDLFDAYLDPARHAAITGQSFPNA